MKPLTSDTHDALLPDDPKGDFSRVVLRYQHPLATFLFQFVHDRETARDLTQEVFVKVHRHLDGYDRSKSFSSWLFAIAANHARDHLRRSRVRTSHNPEALGEAIDPGPGPDESVARSELDLQLDAALERLPLEEREIIILRHVAGLSHQEIGDALGLLPATAKTRIFRARQHLQTLLAPLRP